DFGKAMLLAPFVPTPILGGGLISALGSAEQRAEFIPQIMEGGLQLACAYGEASSRYNLSSVATTAKVKGDSVTIDGLKIAVLNGSNANKLLVVARESGARDEREGISVFMVDADAPGVSIQAYKNLDGKMSAQVNFEAVKVSVTARLGAAGGAIGALETVIDRATVAVSAEAAGALEAMLQKTVEYSKVRKQFGTAIGTFQALQHRMVDMFIECQLARSIVIRAAMKLDSGDDEVEKARAVSAAKSRVGKAIRKVSQEAIQIHGGIGMTDELDVGHLFKCVTAQAMMFGNTDYHTARFAAL
ncbi:MAG: acyl-CoA dehydrogenase family protein, partial [Proteobacteria bacterium]|nr:acyl-CoA dehydrogenase family protein [Pseudomonadota bacterium]